MSFAPVLRTISEFDRNEYEDNGVAVLPRFFDELRSKRLSAAWQSLKRDFAAASLDRSSRFLFGTLPGEIGQLYADPSLVALVQSLLGGDIALYMNRILLKDEHWSGAVAIHQDMPYFNGTQEKISIFVPLQPTQAESGNGGLKFVVGSHKFGNLERGTIDRSKFPPMLDAAPSLEVGDVVIMNFLTWHYSEDAAIQGERPLMQIVYQSSRDGSYGGAKLGVPEPTLVCGTWRTQYFAERGRGVTPDV
jgi:hypothetical protein